MIPKYFYHKKVELLEITEKEPQKLRPKLKKYVYYILTENVCSVCSIMQVVVFFAEMYFVEQRLKFSP